MTSETPYVIEDHPTLPVMMTRFEEDFVFAENAVDYTVTVKKKLDSLSDPVYYLFDLTKWKVMSFAEMMQAAAQAARGKDSNFHHPMNRQTLIITQDTLVSKSAEGMQGAAYDNANIKIFESVDEALDYVRANA